MRYAFSSNTTATDWADLDTSRNNPTGHSSTTHGYSSGGAPSIDSIDKFPHASQTNASDVGDLTTGGYGMAHFEK